MTSADRNDLMPAQEKLEWVTPKISLMEAGDTEGTGKYKGASEKQTGQKSLNQIYLKPHHTYKNQSSQRVCKDPFLVSGGHFRH